MTAVMYHEGRFPPAADQIDWPRLLPLIGPASAAVARYEGVLHGIPNAQVLLSPLTSQEAVLSSKIEGTQATLGEVPTCSTSLRGDQSFEHHVFPGKRLVHHRCHSMMHKVPFAVRMSHKHAMDPKLVQIRALGLISPSATTHDTGRTAPSGDRRSIGRRESFPSSLSSPAHKGQ